MKRRVDQKGSTLIWLLLAIGASLGAGYFFGLLVDYLAIDKPTMPITLMAILIIPSTLTSQLLLKLVETKKIKGLNREESRRLTYIINVKISRLIILLIFYVISAITIGTLFYIATLQVPSYVILWALRTTGALLTLSAFMTVYSVLETRKITEFEAKISNRSRARKAKADMLKRMKPEEKKKDS